MAEMSHLADSADLFSLPPQIQSLIAIGIWALIAASVVGTAAAAVSMWANLRRKPSHDETFATKKEVAELEYRFSAKLRESIEAASAQIKALFSKMDAANRSFQAHAVEMERALGRIEGELKGLGKED